MQKVLLIDDRWYFRAIWTWGLRDKFTFLHANTIEQAKEIFRDHPDLAAIVVDAHMNAAFGIDYRIPMRQWGIDTLDLIAELKLQFNGPIIAAPCQPWHFKLMMNAGCTHYAWKWSVARLLKEILSCCTMGLEESPMRRMKAGLKTVEFRLNQEKWRDIQAGDSIEFQLRDNQNETIVLDRLKVDVLEVVRRPTFQELLEYVYANGWGEQDRRLEDQLESLERRYPEEERSKYPGVVGFRVKPLPQ